MSGQGLEDVPAALAGGGDDRAQIGEDACAFEGSEAAGDFHLHLHHAQVALGQIVGEGDGEVAKEAQDIVFVGLQPFEQIVTGPAFGPSFGALIEGRRRAMKGEACPHGPPISGDEGLEAGRWERKVSFFPRHAHRLAGLDEQFAHVPGPWLAVDFDQRLEFAQMMGVAVGVSDAGQSIIGLEVVMDDAAALKVFWHGAALFRHPVEGQGLGREGMQPSGLAVDAKAVLSIAEGSSR